MKRLLVFGLSLGLVAALAAPATAVASFELKVCATASTGASIPLSTGQVYIKVGSITLYGGATDGDCVVNRENWPSGIPAGTEVDVRVRKDATYSEWQSATINADTTLDFYTTNVTLQYSNGLAYGGATGDSRFFDKPSMELFGGSEVRFRLDSTGGARGRLGLTWPAADGPGKSFTRSLIALRLIDSNGDPLDGGTARYKTNYWSYAPGFTGNEALAPGILAYALPGLVGNLTNEMKFNNTIQTVTQNAASNSVYQFRTRNVTLQLKTADGDPLSGGKARYGRNATYTTWWWPGGLTDGNGKSSAEIFPGTYSFEMLYQGTAQAKTSKDVPDADETFTWNTATVTLYYSNGISYGGGSGDARWFSKPTMNLLAGEYMFHFRSGPRVNLSWGAGDTYTKSMVVANVKDSSGDPIQGAKAEVAPGGSWLPMGNTDADGVAYKLLDGGPFGNTKVRISYHNGSETQIFDQPTHSIFTFATTQATIRLIDHVGAPIEGGFVEQGGGTWIDVGTTNSNGNVKFEVFAPGSYKFRMTYNFGSQEKTEDISTAVVFQTGAVYSDSGTATEYAQGTWKPFTQNIELLPHPSAWHFKFSDGTPVTYYAIVGGQVNNIH